MKSRLFFTLILSFLSLCATSRTTCTIDNGWMFIRQDVPGAEAVNFAANGWQRVNLPHCWNVEDTEDEPYGYYRGIGWYRKSLHLDDIAGQRVFLRFEAANLVADVWVNGVSAGAQHRGGYTPFVFDITDKVHSGDNVIAVKVNNAFNADVPPLDADFTFFGGIYRDVSIIVTPASHFDLTQGNGVFITTPVVAAKSSQVAVKSVVVSDRKNGLYVRHSILDADNRLVASTKVRLKNGVAGEAMMSVANPVLWDVDNPYLYSVLSEVVDKNDSVIDCVRNPLGIRTFKFDAKQGFFLNGRHLKLLGVNRHQDYPNRGNALPDELHRADMKLMKESGINCLRISHYPHDESVLEMCDRYGFICFEECPLINRITVTPEYEADSKSQITEMIKRDFNHPSIVAWNSSNEINITYVNMKDSVARKEYGKKLSAFLGDLNDLIHSLDATRPSMIVLCYEPEMNDAAGFHKADIIAYNKYYGWYEGKIADLSTLVDRIHRLQPDKPVFISEFGSGADVRIHSFHPVLYDHSEEFQLDWFKQSLKTIFSAMTCVAALYGISRNFIPRIGATSFLMSMRRASLLAIVSPRRLTTTSSH
jgi:beta-galactosidase